jgi:8-oxo-dGTP pyrophosphatase MutT (NUDIX family)
LKINQAGGIVVRRDGARLSVLLVRAKRDPTVWIFPKGHIEPGETAEAAALREVQEETGVQGALLGPIGDPLEFQSGHELVRVQYFLIRIIADSGSGDGREKRWLTFDDARRTLSFENARRLIDEISDLRFQI